jgi:hypothetical protein
VVKECVHIETGRYYAAKVINKRLMQGREHMVRFARSPQSMKEAKADNYAVKGSKRNRSTEESLHGPP